MPEAEDPLESPRPRLAKEELAHLLEDSWGMTGELSELHGERDLNFAVSSATGKRFVLKVHNPSDGRDVIEMRSGAMRHVAAVDPALPIPRLIATGQGAVAATIAGGDGRSSEAQLFSFLEGRHAGPAELDERALHGWGRCVAQLGRALRSYFHPSADYQIQWDIRHTSTLRDRLELVEGEAAVLAGEVIDRFDAHVATRLPALRAQVIHNDMSRANVLVDEGLRIVGITDFGDMTHSALVCDLAVALADVLDGREDSIAMTEPMIAGYCALTPLEDLEAELLSDLVAARAATSVVVSTWRGLRHSDAPAFPEGAVELLRLMAREGFERVAARLARAARGPRPGPGAAGTARLDGKPGYEERRLPELLAARRRVLGPLELSYDEPLHLVRGEGVHVFDSSGRSYLDAYNNVPVLGHCHPRVAGAIAAQARRLVTNTRYLHEAAVELCERLLATAPKLDRALLVNSGSEANDLAWRVARHATAASGGLVTSFAYHGITEATYALSPESWVPGFEPPHVGLLAPPPGAPPGTGHAGLQVDQAIAELEARGHRPAALFVDPAFTSEGVVGPAPQWVSAAAAAVRRAGGLFVADEVQAGFGRTGEHLWSFVSTGVEPDLVTLGKPMGNGFPVAAVLGRSELVDPFIEKTGYFSTFGGNTLASAAALAVLKVVEEERLLDHVADVADELQRRLGEIAERHERVLGLRAFGLLFALDVAAEPQTGVLQPGAGASSRSARDAARAVVNRLRRAGVLVGTTGPDRSALKIRPPLVLDRADADRLADQLEEAVCL